MSGVDLVTALRERNAEVKQAFMKMAEAMMPLLQAKGEVKSAAAREGQEPRANSQEPGGKGE